VIETTEVILFGTSLILSGFFSGSEAALMSIPVDRTKQLIEEGGAKAKALEFVAQRPNEILTTILVWNNLVNIFASSLTTSIALKVFDEQAIAYAVGVTTFLVLIFGEIIPKTFARTHAERLALVIIRILQFFYFATYPIIKLFTVVIEKVLGSNAHLRGRVVSKKDIEYLVDRAEKEQSIDSKQIDLLNSILEFPTIKVKDIMVPRQEVCGIEITSGFVDVIKLVREEAHSRYPVFEEDLDSTIGFLHVKDLAFVDDESRENFNMRKFLKPPFFVYEHMKIQAVFDHMNRKKVHLALVKDENGLVVGIVTLEDIMEEIFGEIQDEHDDEELSSEDEHALFEEGVIVEASMTLRDLYSEYDIKIPLNNNYSTIAGFLLNKLGNHFPEKGNIIFWEGFTFELLTVEDHEIKEVKIKNTSEERRFKDPLKRGDRATFNKHKN
jgi:putative hemolysin